MSSLWRSIIEVIWPTRCAICEKSGFDSICPDCRAELLHIGEQNCIRCGRLRKTSFASPDCGECHGQNIGVVKSRSALIYNDAGRKLLADFKYNGNIAAGRVIAAEICNSLEAGLASHFAEPDLRIDLVMPVPLHAKRQRERGYNQAELLALEIAKAASLTASSKLLKRTRETPTQVGLTESQRKTNVRGAFDVEKLKRPDIKGKNVLIVDDLMTTGATLAACASALRRCGASLVYGLTAFSTSEAE